MWEIVIIVRKVYEEISGVGKVEATHVGYSVVPSDAVAYYCTAIPAG